MIDIDKLTWQCVEKIPQLEGIYSEIKIGDHACDILAVEIVVGGVDIPDTPVGVVVTVGAGAKRSLGPKWRSFPMIVIVTEIRTESINAETYNNYSI